MEEIQEKNAKAKTILKRVGIVLECLIVVICITLSIVVIANQGSVDKDGNAKVGWLTVQSDSMTPTIAVGSLVFTQKPSDERYDLGTIVTFVANENGVEFLDTHRIVGYKYRDNTGAFKIDYYKKGEFENFADFEEKHEGEVYLFDSYVTRGDKYTILYGSMDDFGYSKDESVFVTSFNDAMSKDQDEILAVYKNHVKGLGTAIDWIKVPKHFFVVILIPLFLLLIWQIIGLVRMIIKANVQKVASTAQLSEEEIKQKAIEEYLASHGGATVQQVTPTVEEAAKTEENKPNNENN